MKDIDQQKIQECVHWDLHTNFWTTEGATTLGSNASHTICSFNYLSTYAVMQTRNQVTDYNFLAILIGSILLAIAMFSIATIAIIYWRRIKVGRECTLVFRSCCSGFSFCTYTLLILLTF